MASGNDFRIALSPEVTYGTRVAPARFILVTAENFGFTRNRAFSNVLGLGRHARPSVLTNRGGSGSISGEVWTTGFGYLLNGLHGNTVTPVQQAATTAYLQTHTLDTAPSKKYSVQKQMPPVASSTLVPMDYLGMRMTGITVNWSPTDLLTWEIPVIVQDEITGQTLVTYVAPAGGTPHSGVSGASITIGGVAETNVLGPGSFTYATTQRDDAVGLGTGGIIAEPMETEKPTTTATFSADFNDLTNVTRVVNNTVADVIIKFEGATIASTYKYMLEITMQDCVFTSPSPNVDGPGPVQQGITLTAASTTGDPPILRYQSTDTAL